MSGYPADPPSFADIEHSGPDDPAQADQTQDRRTLGDESAGASVEDEQAAAQTAVMGPD